MIPTPTVNVDSELLDDVRGRLGDLSNKAPQAISRALNRAMTNIASNVSKEVRTEYVIKAADIKETLEKSKSTRTNLSAIVKSRGNLIPLDRFKVSPRKVTPKRKTPIKIGVKKNGTKNLKGAFVGDIHGIKVFKRVGRKRLPIDRLFGPSVPQMIGNDEIRERINTEGKRTFDTRLEHEITRILQGQGSGAT